MWVKTFLQVREEHEKCNFAFYENVLTSDKICNFYTGIRTVKEFDVSHNSAARFVKTL